MNSSRAFLLIVFQIAFCADMGRNPVYAETLSKEQEQNLRDAKQEFLDPSKRSENLKKDPKAAKSDELVKEVGGEFSEDIYKLAGDVMDTLASEAQGDPDKMEKILQKAEKDPESFANSFSPEQRKKLKELANKIEQSKSKSKPLP
ncbi:MAG: hypothetical protein FJ116_05410 [Deltaproteobacteria bacterium]|nr:hypothetical protein [Deltaproteobacteria bacterium]